MLTNFFSEVLYEECEVPHKKFQESSSSDQGVVNFGLSLPVLVEKMFLCVSPVGISNKVCAHRDQCCSLAVMLRQQEPTISMKNECIRK